MIESWNAGKMAIIFVIFTNLYLFVLVLTYHYWNKENLKIKSLNFKGVQSHPRLTETRSRAKLFGAELCQNIKTAEGVAWPRLKSTHRINLAQLVPLPDKIDPSQD